MSKLLNLKPVQFFTDVFCPNCQSLDVEGHFGFNYEGDYVYEPVECNECHAEFDVVYVRAFVNNLKLATMSINSN